MSSSTLGGSVPEKKFLMLQIKKGTCHSEEGYKSKEDRDRWRGGAPIFTKCGLSSSESTERGDGGRQVHHAAGLSCKKSLICSHR